MKYYFYIKNSSKIENEILFDKSNGFKRLICKAHIKIKVQT
jgi:hypothetical protein